MSHPEISGGVSPRLTLPFDAARLRAFPRCPGVYRMLDVRGELLYIGKAVNLRNRLRSYFQPSQSEPKVLELVARIADIHITPVGSELEALLLEARLVRELQPYYNRMLKNSKKQAYLKISAGAAPRITASLDIDDAPGAQYFGPFPSQRYLLNRFTELLGAFQLRSCGEATFRHHVKTSAPCLEHALGRCSAPCVQMDEREAYSVQMHQFQAFLQGDDRGVLETLETRLTQASEALNFEQAARLQERLRVLSGIQRVSARLYRTLQDAHGFIVLPDVDPKATRLLRVLGGVPMGWETVSKRTRPETLLRLARAFHAGLAAWEPAAYLGDKSHYEEVRLVAAWLAGPEASTGFVSGTAQSETALAEMLQERLWD